MNAEAELKGPMLKNNVRALEGVVLREGHGGQHRSVVAHETGNGRVSVVEVFFVGDKKPPAVWKRRGVCAFGETVMD